jgi:hypothetical protein
MKKIAIYCLQLLAIVGVASLTSCGTSDPLPTPAGNPTMTSALDAGANYTNNKFERLDTVRIKVSANIPGGVQIFQIWKKDGTVTTGDGTAVTTFNAQFPAAGITKYENVFRVPVTETFDAVNAAKNTITFTFKIKNSQMTNFVTSTCTYEIVRQGQGGGGGAILVLRANATVSLGAQGSTLPSYADSQALVTGATSGLYSSTQAAGLSATLQQAIDLTFGVVGADGNAALGAAATTPQLISPTAREAKGFTNPMGTNARATTFKATTLTALTNLTATTVNNLDHSTGTVNFLLIEKNKIYSFRNARGAKGYILIKDITNTNENREAQIEVMVQQLQ